jgi:uncharacterized protein (DUF488 family)
MPVDRILWTIGHSSHIAEVFVELLRAADIQIIADIRRFPMSRRHPQFNADALTATLQAAGIDYLHFAALGGRRGERRDDSPNTAWRVEAFNAYADHAQSDEFLAALTDLIALAENRRTAVMCAEALPWQCHRRVLADFLIARGWTVRDIFPDGKIKPHPLTEFAKVSGEAVTYPGQTLF